MDPIEQLFQKAVNLINQEIVNFDDEEDILQRELEDVLVEVDTHDSSNNEDIRQVRLHREDNQIVREFKNVLLTVDYERSWVFYEMVSLNVWFSTLISVAQLL